jgi:hypothetical protein
MAVTAALPTTLVLLRLLAAQADGTMPTVALPLRALEAGRLMIRLLTLTGN